MIKDKNKLFGAATEEHVAGLFWFAMVAMVVFFRSEFFELSFSILSEYAVEFRTMLSDWLKLRNSYDDRTKRSTNNSTFLVHVSVARVRA